MTAEAIPFSEQLRRLAEQAPDAPAVSMGGVTRTRGQFAARSNRLARALKARGLAPGDLLTIALPNSIEFMEAAAACWKAGVTPQPVSSRLPAAELDAIAALAKTPFIVGEAGLQSRTPIVTMAELLQECADETPMDDAVCPSWKAPTSGGSTGRPKLIVSTDLSLYAPDFYAFWRIEANDVALIPAPLYHNGPFSTAALALLRGAHLVLTPKFDPVQVLSEVQARHATWLYLVPTMMSRIWRLPPEVRTAFDVSTLKMVWHLAAPCPVWLKRAWIEWLGPDVIWEVYGATEAQAATAITGAEYLRKPGSVGKVIRGEMKVVGPDGQDLPPGEIGDIYERPKPGDPATFRYIGANAAPIEGGWLTMGDVGFIDEEGYVFLSDRKADMILVGGANVYPAEVEAALEEFPGVQSCCVIGLPDDDLGQRVHAIVQPRGQIDLPSLEAHLATRLVRYKLPRSIEIVSESLRDDAGKVRRSQLRAERISTPRQGGENLS